MIKQLCISLIIFYGAFNSSTAANTVQQYDTLASYYNAPMDMGRTNVFIKSNYRKEDVPQVHSLFNGLLASRLDRPLLTMVKFYLERGIEDFNETSLKDPRAIEQISDSTISQLRTVNANTIFFKSVVKVPFASITSDTNLSVYTANEIANIPNLSDFVNYFSPGRLPEVVSLQTTTNFNSFFNSSVLVTFYLATSNPEVMEVRTYGVSNLNKMVGFIERRVVGSVYQKLEELPAILENL